jgi:hypothetical protein
MLQFNDQIISGIESLFKIIFIADLSSIGVVDKAAFL